MEELTDEKEIMAVEKVLEEMKYAEEYLKRWNASWYEQLSDAYCLPLYNEFDTNYIKDLEKKYEPRYDLTNGYHSRIGIPLAKETIIAKDLFTEENIECECDFGKIEWKGLYSKNSYRIFSFSNDGYITYLKDHRYKQKRKHPKQISYDTSFNVLRNDFDIEVFIKEQDMASKTPYDYYRISLRDDIVKKNNYNTEIIENLRTGEKKVKITKHYKDSNKKVALFEATLNKDNTLKNGTLTIFKCKYGKKINGIYQISVNEKNGVRANRYSRKGNKIGLTNNPILLSDINTLLSETLNEENIADRIILDFASTAEQIISDNKHKEVIPFDDSYFNTEEIKDVESQINEVLKCIEGEMPLKGLEERINNYFALSQKLNNSKKEDSKKLRLKR